MELYYLCSEKTKALISCAVTTQLICAFVFIYAKSRFYYDTDKRGSSNASERCVDRDADRVDPDQTA